MEGQVLQAVLRNAACSEVLLAWRVSRRDQQSRHLSCKEQRLKKILGRNRESTNQATWQPSWLRGKPWQHWDEGESLRMQGVVSREGGEKDTEQQGMPTVTTATEARPAQDGCRKGLPGTHTDAEFRRHKEKEHLS